MGPGDAVFLFVSTTPLSAPTSRTSCAVPLTPAISKISRRRTPVHAALPTAPFCHCNPSFGGTLVDAPVACALNDGGQSRAPHRLDAVEVRFDRPLHRPANAQSPVSRIEVGRREMVSHEE